MDQTPVDLTLLQRQNNSFLMKAFLKLPEATKKKLEKCNMCRLYSRVNTMSGISDARETHILWKKISGNWKADSILQLWPMMPKPPRDYILVYLQELHLTSTLQERKSHSFRSLTCP